MIPSSSVPYFFQSVSLFYISDRFILRDWLTLRLPLEHHNKADRNYQNNCSDDHCLHMVPLFYFSCHVNPLFLELIYILQAGASAYHPDKKSQDRFVSGPGHIGHCMDNLSDRHPKARRELLMYRLSGPWAIRTCCPRCCPF